MNVCTLWLIKGLYWWEKNNVYLACDLWKLCLLSSAIFILVTSWLVYLLNHSVVLSYKIYVSTSYEFDGRYFILTFGELLSTILFFVLIKGHKVPLFSTILIVGAFSIRSYQILYCRYRSESTWNIRQTWFNIWLPFHPSLQDYQEVQHVEI